MTFTACWCPLVIYLAAAAAAAFHPVAAILAAGDATPQGGNVERCRPDKLAAYKVVVHTFWSRAAFPKHYPDWRPTAQWSKLIGRSHNGGFNMFRLGQKATAAVKEFAENGNCELFDEHQQFEHRPTVHSNVYDEFTAPGIDSGVGRTDGDFFVEGNHSLVSLMVRMVPSPDWFIGVDSFDLCVNGHWIDTITIEMDPLDAGSDNGFTFTAADWPTEPQGELYRITAHYPAHPAGSFFYPYLKRLPPIATVQFLKMKEYDLNEVYRHDADKERYEVVHLENTSTVEVDAQSNNRATQEEDINHDIEMEIEEERQQEDQHQSHSNILEFHGDDDKDHYIPLMPIDSTNQSAWISNVVDSLPQFTNSKSLQKNRKKHLRRSRDCQVSEWSPWTECSTTCEIGTMQRRRTILQRNGRRGHKCPPLLQTRYCGDPQPLPECQLQQEHPN